MNSKNWLDSCNFILTSNSAQFAKHLSIVSSLHIITIIQCPCLGIFCTIQLPTHLNRNTLQKRKSNNNQTFFFKIMLIFSLLNLLALVFSTQFIYQHITREQLHKIVINITQMRIYYNYLTMHFLCKIMSIFSPLNLNTMLLPVFTCSLPNSFINTVPHPRAFNIFQVNQYFTIYRWYFLFKLKKKIMNILYNTLEK